MSDKTVAEILTAKMKYEGEIEKFLREKLKEFTEETGVPVKAVNVENSSLEVTTFGDTSKQWLFSIGEAKLELDWEGVKGAPVP